jgi:hypothetical protein
MGQVSAGPRVPDKTPRPATVLGQEKEMVLSLIRTHAARIWFYLAILEPILPLIPGQNVGRKAGIRHCV